MSFYFQRVRASVRCYGSVNICIQFRFRHRNTKNAYMMMPRHHQSAGNECGSPATMHGARYSGVPHSEVDVSDRCMCLRSVAHPEGVGGVS